MKTRITVGVGPTRIDTCSKLEQLIKVRVRAFGNEAGRVSVKKGDTEITILLDKQFDKTQEKLSLLEQGFWTGFVIGALEFDGLTVHYHRTDTP